VLLASGDGAGGLVNNPAARDFVADAFAHSKSRMRNKTCSELDDKKI
jgi:hypothetical protein